MVMEKEHMFGDLGESTVLFEKAMSKKGKNVKKVIADVLVFTEKKGIIGVEIKTERDSTQRLLRQLRSYATTCDFVYVVCHDLHVEAVEKILKRHKFHYVGIIAYVEFRGAPTAGVYKEATRSPEKSVFHALNMLWKTELLRLLSTLRNPHKVAMAELDAYKGVKLPKGVSTHTNTYTRRMKKSQVISELISWLGPEEANKVLCNVFLNNRLDIERSIRLRHFNKGAD